MGDIAQRGNRLTAAKGGRIGKFGGGRTNLLEQLGRVEAEPSNRNRRAEISRVHGELNRGYKTGGRAGYAIGKAVRILGKKFKKKKDFKTHGRDVPTMAATGGRIGLNKGGKSKPWGTGPKPGTLEFLQHTTQTPRKKKAIGGVLHAVGKLAKKFKKKKVYPETEDLTHQKGPYVGDVGSEKRVKKAKGGRAGKYQETYRPPQQKKSERQDFSRKRKEFKKGGSDKKWIQKAVNPKHKGYCTPMTKKTCTPARKALARTFKKKAKTGW